jgi:hypothetical protein
MNEQEYFDERVNDQINWYEKKGSSNKKMFLRLKVSETILALLIPLLVGYITDDMIGLKVIVGLIGVVVAVLANTITLFKFQENWVEYRAVAESLKHEKYLYITKAGIYTDGNTFPVFVERFEGYLSKENAQWTTYIKYKKEEEQNS